MQLISLWLLTLAVCLIIGDISVRRVMSHSKAPVTPNPSALCVSFYLLVGCLILALLAASVTLCVVAIPLSLIFGIALGKHRRYRLSLQRLSWYQSGSF